jgi:hypothetical protein
MDTPNVLQFNTSQYADKVELVFREYEKSLDLDIALCVVPLSAAERERIIVDPDLAARIDLCDARVREDLIADLRYLSKNADSEGVRLTALKELGRTLYPKRFKDAPVNGANLPPRKVTYELVEATE